MEYKYLGNSGLKVSVFSLGTMTFGYPTDKETSIKIINMAIDSGINLIDTAHVYPMKQPFGVTEEIIGETIKGKRDSVFIATKVWPGKNSRQEIIKEVEGSLKRLKTDYIDLYQLHGPNINIPFEETMEAMDRLIKQGKVRYIGCSNYDAWMLCKSLWISDKYNYEKFISNQVVYNLLNRKIEEEVVPLCIKENVGILVYSPKAGGVLTGKYKKGKIPKGSRYEKDELMNGYGTDENLKIADEFCEIAKKAGYTPSQLSILWACSQPGITSVIIGASKVEHFKEDMKVFDKKLDEEIIKKLNSLTDYTVQKGVGWYSYKERMKKTVERRRELNV